MSATIRLPRDEPAEAAATTPLARDVFRQAMSRLAAAVTIVTSVGDEGWCGFTASAVTSVTDQPPTLLACINRTAQSHRAILSSRILCVNVTARAHEALAMQFAGGQRDMAARFAAARWTTHQTGAPVLEDAAVAFDCRVTSLVEVGTHDVVIAEVVAVSENDAAGGLVYFGRRFHPLA